MKKVQEIPKRLIIKKTKFRSTDWYYLSAFLFSIFLVFLLGTNAVSQMLFIITLGIIVFKLIHRLRDNAEQIVVDENGITLGFKHKKLIKWDIINFAYIKQTVNRKKIFSRTTNCFHIETVSKEFTIEMRDFSYDPLLLTRCINYFSGREIGIKC